MKIIIATRCLHLPINTRKIQNLAETLHAYAHRTAQRNQAPDFDTITLEITDDAGIQHVNRLALNHEGPTDVIALSYAATPGTPATAEIFVNAQRASEVAATTRVRPWSDDHELALYIAHGFDHLAGNNDTTPNESRNMRKRELDWVRRADALGLINGLMPRKKNSSAGSGDSDNHP